MHEPGKSGGAQLMHGYDEEVPYRVEMCGDPNMDLYRIVGTANEVTVIKVMSGGLDFATEVCGILNRAFS
jgi:hypothetical protein